ncbi:MAG: HAD family phosphatase [Saprospiraceae bacterium]
MKPSKIRNLLFDLGNVIIDLDIDKTFAELEKILRPEADKKNIERIALEYECGRISTDIFLNTLIGQSNATMQAIDIINAWNGMLIGIPHNRLEMLSALRSNFNVYLLSNTNELHLDWVHRHLKEVHGVHDFEKRYFDQSYYSHLIGDRKPQPSIFKHIIDDAFMIPELTLYMDDVKDNLDVAENLGFNTYLVREGEDVSEYLKGEGYF